mmetsp:Transcript_73593/g.208482  ORF Transcript_73593/g.208482 Transcript_73593/m.208482 type:complete len:264 (+) Transcript_73593:1029-1820(+)
MLHLSEINQPQAAIFHEQHIARVWISIEDARLHHREAEHVQQRVDGLAKVRRRHGLPVVRVQRRQPELVRRGGRSAVCRAARARQLLRPRNVEGRLLDSRPHCLVEPHTINVGHCQNLGGGQLVSDLWYCNRITKVRQQNAPHGLNVLTLLDVVKLLSHLVLQLDSRCDEEGRRAVHQPGHELQGLEVSVKHLTHTRILHLHHDFLSVPCELCTVHLPNARHTDRVSTEVHEGTLEGGSTPARKPRHALLVAQSVADDPLDFC